jgi:methyl-accepting chemotaxis protein
MTSFRNIRISRRVILSFTATGVVLVLLTLFFRGKLERDSDNLRDELAQFRDVDQRCRQLYMLSFELGSTVDADLTLGKTSADYKSLATHFSQELSAVRSMSNLDEASILDDVSSLWQKVQLVKLQEQPVLGENRQKVIDSTRVQYSAIRTKLAMVLSMMDEDFFKSQSKQVESMASIKDEVSYIACLLVFILTLGGFFWYRSLTAPLGVLMSATRKISDGEWGTRVDFRTRDEFGMLGESFNKMSEVIARLASCLNEVGNPVYSVDKQYILQFANKASLEFAGARGEDVVSKRKCYEVFNLPFCQTPDCPVARAWNEHRMVTGETSVSTRSRQVPVLFQAAGVSGPDREAPLGIEMLTDITQMKRVASEMETERKHLSEGINGLLEKMTHFAEGDLTVDLNAEGSDDIGKLYEGFKQSIKNITAIIEELIDAVESTASASSQISSSIEELAAGVSQQSAQANDVAASVEQMSRSVTDSARNASKVEQAARENGRVAQSGGEVVQRTVVKMKEIADVVKESSERVNQLGELSKQISEIVSVIGDIADQTNLLALNAAIEAARAGDEGRGFAVVADEVRKLAERTTQATKQISTMIRNIQSSTAEAVASMHSGIQEVTSGLVLADEAGSSLKDIVDNAHGIVDMISQIAAANEEQSSTSSEISKNVEMISTVSLQSANGISQIAGAADDLNRMTTNLQKLIARFKLNKERVGHRTTSSLKGSHHGVNVGPDFAGARPTSPRGNAVDSGGEGH